MRRLGIHGEEDGAGDARVEGAHGRRPVKSWLPSARIGTGDTARTAESGSGP